MKKEFKVQAISDKVEILEVNGQEYSYNCLHNCHRDILVGNTSTRKKGCRYIDHADAYRKVEY
ncbi:Uncharacterised protein [[Clostridium] sordellii]|uniref:hypothetical protein n=1 Tax=Paraclostridium sordellii TaxID=1505 RepID=UPI0005DD5660|nr:hypothetical protein [Paeniclostridium sordellii]CEP45493.1 Uncharacterised protein [[Clostridium] sordellii] [Paeniclostridium sordellii]